MKRKNISGGAPWEETVGYSRAVKVGNMIFVSGTTAIEENGNVVGKGDAYLQTKFVFEKIGKALQQAGASFENVVRTRTFITDISQWEKFGKAHGEVFKNIRPASTLVEVKALINPEMLVEIEVDAVVE